MPHISISEIQYVHINYQRLCDIINTNLYAIAFVKFMIYKFYICDLCDTNCSYYTGHRSTLVEIHFVTFVVIYFPDCSIDVYEDLYISKQNIAD